jgi:capsular polysaccharide transport system ATP-binding protein
MIELRNVTKSYPVKSGQRYILRDVSLVIPDRLNIAVLGPNGAGKSIFLRLIGGVESADSGTIISDSDVSWPLGLTSGFQGSLTGRQNVLFVCSINGLRSAQTSDVTNQVIDFAEIGEYFDMPVNTYSSGMRARLSFGLSMAFQFDVYLVDELTSVGDAIFREKAKAAFEKIRKRASLIFVSHNLKTLRESCQSALFLRDGLADFYPHIEDGITAYAEYIQSHRNHGLPMARKEHDKLNDPNTRSDQQARKRARKQARKQAQKQAHKIARPLKKADDASPPTNLP